MSDSEQVVIGLFVVQTVFTLGSRIIEWVQRTDGPKSLSTDLQDVRVELEALKTDVGLRFTKLGRDASDQGDRLQKLLGDYHVKVAEATKDHQSVTRELAVITERIRDLEHRA